MPLPSPIGSVYTDKSLEAGSTLMVARRWEEWDGGFLLMSGDSDLGDGNVLELVAMAKQPSM